MPSLGNPKAAFTRIDNKFSTIDLALVSKASAPTDAGTFDPTMIDLSAGVLNYDSYLQTGAIALALDPVKIPAIGSAVVVNIVGNGSAITFPVSFVGLAGFSSGTILENGVSYPFSFQFAPDWFLVSPGVFEDRVLIGVVKATPEVSSTIYTANFTVGVGTVARTDTTAGGFTATAPASPADRAELTLEDAAEGGSWSLASPLLLVTSDGSTLAGNPGAAGVDHDGGTRALWRYNATEDDWVYLGEAGGTSTGTGSGATVDLLDLGTPVIALFPGMDQTATSWGHQLGVTTDATAVSTGTPALRQDGALRFDDEDKIAITAGSYLSDRVVFYIDANVGAGSVLPDDSEFFWVYSGAQNNFGFYVASYDILLYTGAGTSSSGTSPGYAASGRTKIAGYIDFAAGTYRAAVEIEGVRSYISSTVTSVDNPAGRSDIDATLGNGIYGGAQAGSTDIYAAIVAKDVASGLSTAQIDASLSSLIDRMSVYGPPSVGGGTWGTIGGTLSAQIDLQTALNAKQADLAVPSQAEAEAGIATTERVWTAQRVSQAILAQAGENSFGATTPFGAGRTNEDTRSLIERLQSSRIYSVLDWEGIDPDAGSDSTTAIANCINALNASFTPPTGADAGSVGARRTLYVPLGTYLVANGGLPAVKPGINVWMDGAFSSTNPRASGTHVIIGDGTANNRGCLHRIRLRGFSGGLSNDYLNDSFIGVQFFNAVNCRIFLDHATEYNIGAQFISRSTTSGIRSTNNNDVFCGAVSGRIGIDIITDGVNGAACWNTNFRVYGGQFMGNDVPSTIDQFGVRIRMINNSGTLHSQYFEGCQFDSGVSATNARYAFELNESGVTPQLGFPGVVARSLYTEITKMARIWGTTPIDCSFETRRYDSDSVIVDEPEATTPSRTRVLSAITNVQQSGGAITVARYSVGRRHEYTGSGHTVTVNITGNEGEIHFRNKGSGNLTFAAGTSTAVGSLTVIPPGAAGWLEMYDRGRSYRLHVNGYVERVTRGVGSSQPTAGDSGATITSDGALTIPNVLGWNCRLRLGGDHDLTFDMPSPTPDVVLDVSAQSPSWAAGDSIYIEVGPSNTVELLHVASGSIVTQADFA